MQYNTWTQRCVAPSYVFDLESQIDLSRKHRLFLNSHTELRLPHDAIPPVDRAARATDQREETKGVVTEPLKDGSQRHPTNLPGSPCTAWQAAFIFASHSTPLR